MTGVQDKGTKGSIKEARKDLFAVDILGPGVLYTGIAG